MSTNTTPTTVSLPSKFPQDATSVALSQLMERAHKLEIGARIKRLREESPYGQASIAEQLGIGLRAYQKLEEVGTVRWERVQELAKIHEVEARWIWDGENQGETPDVIAALDGDRLSRIEEQLLSLRTDLAELGVDVAQDKVQRQKWQRRARGSRKRAAAR